jgi:hypothetical protein
VCPLLRRCGRRLPKRAQGAALPQSSPHDLPRDRPLRGNRRSRPQPLLHLLMPNHSSLLHYHPATRKNHKVRYPSNLKASRKLRVLFRIHLEHNSLPRHVGRGPRDLRRGHLARPAPVRPEIHQHRNLRILNDFIEQRLIRRQRFANRRQWRLARPATPGTCKMFPRNAILLSTRAANTDHRHIPTPRYTRLYDASQRADDSTGFDHVALLT